MLKPVLVLCFLAQCAGEPHEVNLDTQGAPRKPEQEPQAVLDTVDVPLSRCDGVCECICCKSSRSACPSLSSHVCFVRLKCVRISASVSCLPCLQYRRSMYPKSAPHSAKPDFAVLTALIQQWPSQNHAKSTWGSTGFAKSA